MRRVSLWLVAIMTGVLAVAVVVGLFYLGAVNSNYSPTPTTPFAAPIPTVAPTISMTPTPAATRISGHTVTYRELSRNQTMIVIQFKLEPNSYIFQLNATSFILTEDGARISVNANDATIIGTQYSTRFFPVNGYNGTDYHLSSDLLPLDTVWIKQ